jgi:hypothetical protein
MDEDLSKKIEGHLERIEMRSVTLAPDAKVVVVEVPPFPRFD